MKKKVLKGMGLTTISLIILMIIVIIVVKVLNLNAQIPVIDITSIDLSVKENGVYIGECDAGLVKVAVSVEVKDNKIVDIIINNHQNGLGKKAEVIVEDIIDKQSLDVDVISGATFSSNAIRKAVEVALTK